MSGGNIDSQTIERWTKQSWRYKGVFKDDINLPLAIRWEECRKFLKNKGYSSRPEALGEQIPGIRGVEFKTILQWELANSKVDEITRIIGQVARRWQTPTNQALRARLLIARAANRAWEQSLRYFGPFTTRSIRGSFAWLYNRYMDVCLSTERDDMDGKMDRHMELEDVRPSPYKITAGAMLSRECEALLPIVIYKLVQIAEEQDEENFNHQVRKLFPGKATFNNNNQQGGIL